jgi:hypothetical protein
MTNCYFTMFCLFPSLVSQETKTVFDNQFSGLLCTVFRQFFLL